MNRSLILMASAAEQISSALASHLDTGGLALDRSSPGTASAFRHSQAIGFVMQPTHALTSRSIDLRA